MEFAGIIAEYDPFHNGHAWQLRAAQALGARCTAVALSCGLTQRGALPLLPEPVRVRAALACGAGLVFALPAPYACAGAEAFARAGVWLLASAGCDALVFGAETPDPALLLEAARVLCSDAYRAALRGQLAAGARSFAAARQAAAEAVCPGGPVAALLGPDHPNDHLAVEYCKAILELGVSLSPVPLPRQGAGHGQALSGADGAFASASALRSLWQSTGPDALAAYVPDTALPLYRAARMAGQDTDFEAAGHAQLALLRAACAGREPFATIRGVSEGLEHRLAAAVRAHTSPGAVLEALTTARYPRARMRRLMMDAALGCEAGTLPALPPYLHLLGGRRAALPRLRDAALPASPSLARLARVDADCAACAAAQAAASDFAAYCRHSPAPMGEVYRQKAIFWPEC